MNRPRRKRIQNRLKKHRRMMGFQQKQVGEMLGFKSANRISKWEQGLGFPSVPNLIKLSILYRTFADQLYVDLYREFKSDLFEKMKEIFISDNDNNHETLMY